MASLLLLERLSKSKVGNFKLFFFSVNVGSLIKLDISLIGSQTKQTLVLWSFKLLHIKL